MLALSNTLLNVRKYKEKKRKKSILGLLKPREFNKGIQKRKICIFLVLQF